MIHAMSMVKYGRLWSSIQYTVQSAGQENIFLALRLLISDNIPLGFQLDSFDMMNHIL